MAGSDMRRVRIASGDNAEQFFETGLMSSGQPFIFTGRPTGEHERTLAELVGQRIESVRYLLLRDGTDEVEDWDFDRWHRATMGVCLTLTSGTTYTATWMQYPWQWGVQVFPGPHRSAVDDIVDVTQSARWQPLIGEPITAATAVYDPTPPPDDGPRPVVAIRLETSSTHAWIAAAESKTYPEPDSDLWIGAQAISVIFDPALAERVGIT